MKPLGLSSSALDVKPARINGIVRERRGISADTALRLGRFFGTDVQSWMNLQTQYDIQCGGRCCRRCVSENCFSRR